MNIGDTFVDPQKRTWTLESELGQGTWGRSFRAKTADGQQCVLKVALQSSDFPTDTPLPEGLVRTCREAAREQIALLEKSEHPFLPRLLGSFTTSAGSPALMLAHYDTLERRIAAGAGLAGTCNLLARLAHALGSARFVHGNLRPSNILVNERGEPVVSDPITPSLFDLFDRLEQLAGSVRWRPPEATNRPRPGWDTWALCQCLYQAALHRDIGSEARPADRGLDKVEIATLKDRALARFKQDRTNPRFQSRMADRLGALLHRGLSLPTEPSPPYRFVDCPALAERLDEVVALVDPHVEDVGRLLPPAESVSGVFRGDKPVDFTVSVGCSAGVTHHEDVICGMKLIDLDEPDQRIPIPEATYKVERHRSGRLRFAFSVPDLPPGRYRLKIAFTVRDAGTEPQVAAGEFEVRPPPGYVPPAPRMDEKAPIVLDRIRNSALPEADPDFAPSASRSPTSPGSSGPRIHATFGTDASELDEDDLASDPDSSPDAFEHGRLGFPTQGTQGTSPSDPGSEPGAEIIEGLFPRPIAPPTDQPDTSIPVEVQHVPTEAIQPPPMAEPIQLPRQAIGQAGPSSWGGPSTAGTGAVPSMGYAPSSPGALGNFPAGGAQSVPTGGGLNMPSISIGQGPTASPSIGAPTPGLRPPQAAAPTPPAAAPAPPAPDPAGNWFSGHVDDFGLEGDGLLPGIHGEGEELPDWNPERLGDKLRSIPGFDTFFEWMQRDAYTAFVAAAAGSFLLLLVMMALLKAI